MRFSAHGVEVNRNSPMYYLNQVRARVDRPGSIQDEEEAWELDH